ncbi:putative transcriptional regulator [Methanohalophilus levihalophilus]|uniref:helix-turn-helix transcriptional regulator n=1 Tax=Methanohalophilus levihalophilus TaxID=1431282 RepID=UPI001AEA17C7|nr:winged helix-turn-helix domain-containing protein [Methanohalophilus levihalophilus]MBP2030996.1 putative transcriptional regulator [Methanohalophilus levihalophilus]
MGKKITDILFASDKRKNTLLMLQDGPKEMDTILKSLNTTRAALLPQMKVLKDRNLISKNGDTYSLTTIGKLLVEEMDKFLNTAEIFAGENTYLNTHCIDFLPECLLKKIPELGDYKIVDIPADKLFDSDWGLVASPKKTDYWFEITSTLHPTFHDCYIKIAEGITDVSIIFSSEVYERAKLEYYDELKELIELDFISLYVCSQHMDFVSLTMSGDSIKFNLLTNKGYFDNKRMIFSGPDVVDWGRELFNYYMNFSKPIVEIV